MYNAKASVVKNWMAVGKLLILLIISLPLHSAAGYENPRFGENKSNTTTGQILAFSFGWFKTLSDPQKAAYHQSIAHAVLNAENGQKVDWYQDDASGFAVPVVTWPTGSGYCRRVYIEIIAYNMRKNKTLNACFDNAQDNWQWYPNK